MGAVLAGKRTALRHFSARALGASFALRVSRPTLLLKGEASVWTKNAPLTLPSRLVCCQCSSAHYSSARPPALSVICS